MAIIENFYYRGTFPAGRRGTFSGNRFTIREKWIMIMSNVYIQEDTEMNQQLLRKLPKVDDLLRTPELEALRTQYPEQTVTDAVRQVIAGLRQSILSGEIDELPSQENLFAKIGGQIRSDVRPSMRTVINGTGIVLHTNLGRACLSEKAAQAASDAARRYSTLEYNVSTGGRGLRYTHVEELICRLTGAESALVVNNNAAAVLLYEAYRQRRI